MQKNSENYRKAGFSINWLLFIQYYLVLHHLLALLSVKSREDEKEDLYTQLFPYWYYCGMSDVLSYCVRFILIH